MLPEAIDRFLLNLSNEDLRALADELNIQLGFVVSSPITRLELILTEDCPFRCDYCFVKGKSSEHRMSSRTAKAAVDLLLHYCGDSKRIEINLFGGEPLLEFPLIKRVIRYALDRASAVGKKVTWSLTTNGLLVDREKMDFFQSHDILLLLSIDGDKQSQDTHRRLADGGPTFDLVFPKIEFIKQHQAWLGTRMTVTPDTVRSLAENVRFLHEVGIHQFIIGTDHDRLWTRFSQQSFLEQMEAVAHYYMKQKEADSAIRIVSFEKTPDEIAQGCKAVWGCEAGHEKITVTTSGSIFGCSKFLTGSGGTGRYCLGHVNQGITTPRLRAELLDGRSYIRGKCFHCDYAAYCTGGCPADNLLKTGSIFIPDERDCFWHKVGIDLLRKLPGLPMVHRQENKQAVGAVTQPLSGKLVHPLGIRKEEH